MTTMTAAGVAEHELSRLREEFVSMPGLCLNILQAARLLDVDRDCAGQLLEQLEDEGLLQRAVGDTSRRSAPWTH